MTNDRRLTVAVATYRRPEELRELLPQLVAQADEARAAGWEAEVLVVDNDPDRTGAPVVSAHLATSPPDGAAVRYTAEPEPGIASARNRALDEARDSRLLVFVDDDEQPHPGWLRLLLATREQTSAAAVAGAVESAFDGDLEPWVAAGDFFRRRRPPTGTEITVAATNNLLLDLAVVRRLGLRFDAAFGITGGSDTLFTRRLTSAGHRMVWCDEAVVTDRVPAVRMTRDWVLRRAFRSGNTDSRVRAHLAGSGRERLRGRLVSVGRGLPRVVGGAGQWAAGRLLGRTPLRARGLRTVARGAGMLAGAVGVTYAEYRRPVAAAA